LIPSPSEAPASKRPARDFTLNDVALGVTNYRLFVNGEMVTADAPTGGCAGAIIWFYLPERGRFILSLQPHPGYDFQKVGVIEHNRILFSLNGDQYEWRSEAPIVGQGGNWHLWVLHEAAYQPDETWGTLSGRPGRDGRSRPNCCLIGAANSVELLWHKPAPAATQRIVARRPYRMLEPDRLAPDLCADRLQAKFTLAGLPGANHPESSWEVSYQIYFISEAEFSRVQEQMRQALASKGGAFGWNPRPAHFLEKILLAEGGVKKTGGYPAREGSHARPDRLQSAHS
jgi:hypothetical protein